MVLEMCELAHMVALDVLNAMYHVCDYISDIDEMRSIFRLPG